MPASLTNIHVTRQLNRVASKKTQAVGNVLERLELLLVYADTPSCRQPDLKQYAATIVDAVLAITGAQL